MFQIDARVSGHTMSRRLNASLSNLRRFVAIPTNLMDVFDEKYSDASQGANLLFATRY